MQQLRLERGEYVPNRSESIAENPKLQGISQRPTYPSEAGFGARRSINNRHYSEMPFRLSVTKFTFEECDMYSYSISNRVAMKALDTIPETLSSNNILCIIAGTRSISHFNRV